MPSTPNKLNVNFGRNTYNVFNARNSANCAEQQKEQKTVLLEEGHGNGVIHIKNGVDYINLGEEDQMEIYGYKRNLVRTATIWFLIISSGGLLRLFFHWFPQFMLLATHSTCPLQQAETVLLIEKFQGKHTSYHIKKLQCISAEEVMKTSFDTESVIVNEPWTDSGSTVTIKEEKEKPMLSVHLAGGHFKEIESVITFSCKKLTYVWDNERCEFMKLRGLDTGVFTSTLHQMTGLNVQQQYMRRSVYGNNEIVIPVKSILTLLCLEVLNPFYVFQIFSFCLWISDDYIYYAVVILAMLVFSVSMAVFQTRKNQRDLRSTVSSSDVATVVRDRLIGQTATIPAEQLVPGDILVIPSHGCLMPCDAVLLTGNCILNESMLTGESVPVTKTPIPSSTELMYDAKEHARHTLYCGTRVLQTRYFGNEKVLAVVIRTGFSTSKGGLIRSIMYPPPVDFKFEQDSYKFVELLAGIASIGVIYTVVTKIMRGVPSVHIILEALDLVTIVVPPALPAAMTVGRLVAQNRLVKKHIYCTSPRAINVSGSIDCVCFDKTGTLTEDGLDMWGIVSVSSKKFQYPIKDIKNLPLNETLVGMVTCHGITIIDNQLVGDPLDLKMFESTGWILEEPDVSDTSKFSMLFPTVVRPPCSSRYSTKISNELTMTPMRQNSMNSDVTENISLNNLDTEMASSTMSLTERGVEIGIVRQFPFTSSLQRMSVITRTLGANHYDLYCKGSPEIIHSLSRPETIPSDFDSILQEYTSEGYRVIALAHKSLKRLPYTKVQRMPREAAETDLTFLGFVILENRLKSETSEVIAALNAACIKVVMVTGDNMLTALSVARDCDIIKPSTPIIVVTAVLQQNQLMPQVYFTRSNSHQSSNIEQTDINEIIDINSVVSLETIESGSFTNNRSRNDVNYITDDVYHASNKYVFSLTGKTWALVKQHYPELIPKLATRGAVFARMSPDQKQQLVQELQGLGYYVAMVGDGANDCGALKAAHTGISLSDTESSVASPFTSRETNIRCVLAVIREGRAALVTSFGIFKYMVAYSLTQFISVMLLYGIESNLTDREFLYIDLFIISMFAFFFGRTKAYNGPLVKQPPLTSLISVTPMLSLTSQILVIAIVQYTSLWHLQQMEGYKQFNASAKDKDDVGCPENYTIFIVSSFQYIILAVVFSKGHPYRKSVFTNYGLVASFVFLTFFSTYLAINPFHWLADFFQLVLPSNISFRFIVIGYGILNFIVSIFLEHFVIEYLIFRKLRHKWHNIDKSKRRYLKIERDMAHDPKWPPLSQEPLPAVVPDNLIRQNVTEVKIEKCTSEPYESVEGLISSPERTCSGIKSFGSTKEVTLNPRSLFNDRRNTISLQAVPHYFEEREVTPLRQLPGKRRHNSESDNESRLRNQEMNAIATLPRHSSFCQQQQKLRDLKNVLLHKSEDLVLRTSAQNGLELNNLPS